jgi:hypothetical protein
MSDDAASIPEPTDKLAWAKQLVEKHAWVMHVQSRTVGRVAELYDGEGKLWQPPESDRPVKAPVLKFEQGHTFLARDPGAFIEFTGREASFFQDAQASLAGALSELAQLGAAKGVIGQTGILLLTSALRQQLRELERLHPGTAPA